MAETLGIETYYIQYDEWVPSSYYDYLTGSIKVRFPCQRVIPNSTVHIGRKKQRINVLITFNSLVHNNLEYNKKLINSILKRQYELEHLGYGFRIKYSVNPHLIVRRNKNQ